MRNMLSGAISQLNNSKVKTNIVTARIISYLWWPNVHGVGPQGNGPSQQIRFINYVVRAKTDRPLRSLTNVLLGPNSS